APGSTTIIARYAYADLPVRLGPFIGNGQGLVFIVKDSRNGDCAADFRITAPNCTSPCDLSNIQTDIGDCVNGEFYFKLNFNHQATSDTFLLFAGNSTTMMSRHAYADLPVRLGPFPGNGQSLFFL